MNMRQVLIILIDEDRYIIWLSRLYGVKCSYIIHFGRTPFAPTRSEKYVNVGAQGLRPPLDNLCLSPQVRESRFDCNQSRAFAEFTGSNVIIVPRQIIKEHYERYPIYHR
jgi:hypothetical protein